MKKVYAFLGCLFLMAMSCGPNYEYAEPGEARYLVIHSARGHGFGNRIRALASGHVLAKQTGRKLVIDWEPSKGELPVGFNDLFKNSIETPAKLGLDLSRARLINLNKLEQNGLLPICLDGNDLVKTIVIESYFRFIKCGLKFEEIDTRYADFLKSLVPVDSVIKEVEDYTNRNEFKKGNVIGVHFRSFTLAGDEGFEGRSSLGERRNSMLDAIKSEASGNPSLRFFLATDDLWMSAQLRVELGDRLLQRDVSASRANLNGMLGALVDWYLLGKTQEIIGTVDSSFSDEAAFLTERSSKRGIGPWFF